MLIMDKTKNFVIWLDGYLDACGSKLDSKQTEKVKQKLNDIFEHEAESLDEEIILNIPIEDALGYGKPPFTDAGGETVYRC